MLAKALHVRFQTLQLAAYENGWHRGETIWVKASSRVPEIGQSKEKVTKIDEKEPMGERWRGGG